MTDGPDLGAGKRGPAAVELRVAARLENLALCTLVGRSVRSPIWISTVWRICDSRSMRPARC